MRGLSARAALRGLMCRTRAPVASLLARSSSGESAHPAAMREVGRAEAPQASAGARAGPGAGGLRPRDWPAGAARPSGSRRAGALHAPPPPPLTPTQPPTPPLTSSPCSGQGVPSVPGQEEARSLGATLCSGLGAPERGHSHQMNTAVLGRFSLWPIPARWYPQGPLP